MSALRAFAEDRNAVRDEVHYRTWATDHRHRRCQLTIANISGRGMMARCDSEHQVGDHVMITLPVVGVVAATVRWAVLGRIGCEFDQPIEPARYYALLATLLASARP